MYKYAVIMATYNGELFIQEQLDSIREQSQSPELVYIIDDCSTDTTKQCIEDYISEFQLSHWKIKCNDKNLGWMKTFQKLLIESQFFDVDVIFFADQDDIWMVDRCENQIRIIEENPQVQVLTGNLEFRKIGETGIIPDIFPEIISNETISEWPIRKTYVGNPRQGMTFAIRKSFSDLVIEYYKNEPAIFHDRLFSGIAGLVEGCYNLNKVVAIQNRHNSNASGNGEKVGFSTPKGVHVEHLKEIVTFHKVAYKVLESKGSPFAEEQKNYCKWAEKRYFYAKNNKLLPVIKQVLLDKKYYGSTFGMLRDIFFALKR